MRLEQNEAQNVTEQDDGSTSPKKKKSKAARKADNKEEADIDETVKAEISESHGGSA